MHKCHRVPQVPFFSCLSVRVWLYLPAPGSSGMWYETALQSAQSTRTTSSSPHHNSSPRGWPGGSYPFDFGVRDELTSRSSLSLSPTHGPMDVVLGRWVHGPNLRLQGPDFALFVVISVRWTFWWHSQPTSALCHASNPPNPWSPWARARVMQIIGTAAFTHPFLTRLIRQEKPACADRFPPYMRPGSKCATYASG